MDDTEVMPDELSASQIRGALATLIYNQELVQRKLRKLERRQEAAEVATMVCVIGLVILIGTSGKVNARASLS